MDTISKPPHYLNLHADLFLLVFNETFEVFNVGQWWWISRYSWFIYRVFFYNLDLSEIKARQSNWTPFPGMNIPIIKIRRPWDYLTFVMGITILVRWRLYTETAHSILFMCDVTTHPCYKINGGQLNRHRSQHILIIFRRFMWTQLLI